MRSRNNASRGDCTGAAAVSWAIFSTVRTAITPPGRARALTGPSKDKPSDIALGFFKANRHNGIVSTMHDVAKWLVGPFDGMFTPKDRKLGVAISWGIALVVYVIVGRFIASALRRPLARSR